MGWQYRVVETTDPDGTASEPIEDLEAAQRVQERDRASYPWPESLVIQKRWVGDWGPLEGAPVYWKRATTEGPRKAWDYADEPPEGEGWELDYSRGRPGEAWDRLYYTEERYWRRWVGEGNRPADETTPYVGADGTRLTIEEARVTRLHRLFPIEWEPENPKLL